MSENLPRVGSALIVKDEANRILLGKRNKDPQRGNWILPGGKIHAFESIAEAAARELAEETGLTVEVQNQFRVYEVINSPEEHRIVIYSWARATGGTLRASDDVSEVRFVSLRELGDLPLTPLVKQVLADAGYISESLPFAAEKSEDESPCLFAMPIAGAIQGTRTSEGDTRMMDELQAKCGALLMDVAAAQRDVKEWMKNTGFSSSLECSSAFLRSRQQLRDIQQLADERGREVERLRAALSTALTHMDHREDVSEVCYDWCPKCKVESALATPAATPPAQTTYARASRDGDSTLARLSEGGDVPGILDQTSEGIPFESGARALHSTVPPNPVLAALLAAAKQLPPMTPQQLREQRISFAYGNVGLHNSAITRDMVEAEHDKLYPRVDSRHRLIEEHSEHENRCVSNELFCSICNINYRDHPQFEFDEPEFEFIGKCQGKEWEWTSPACDCRVSIALATPAATPPAQEHPDTAISFMFLNPLDQSPMIAKTFEATRELALEYLGREDWAGEHVTKLGIYRVEKVGEVTAPEAQR